MDKEQYREQIIEMVKQIENETFLKRIFISIKGFLAERAK